MKKLIWNEVRFGFNFALFWHLFGHPKSAPNAPRSLLGRPWRSQASSGWPKSLLRIQVGSRTGHFGDFGVHHGLFGTRFGALWTSFGTIWLHLGPSRAHFGTIFYAFGLWFEPSTLTTYQIPHTPYNIQFQGFKIKPCVSVSFVNAYIL